MFTFVTVSDFFFINILKNYKCMFLLRDDKKETSRMHNDKKMIAAKNVHMKAKAAINESFLFFWLNK